MELPATFGKYELLEKIATGGMAEVFLARSFGMAGFEKRLVIKRIRPELAENPRFVTMFINEAKIAVNLSHPNVVQLYELGRVGQSWFMAMEHLHGRDLTRLVKTLRAQGDKLPVPLAVFCVAEICRGLAYAHGRTAQDGSPLGIVHRDVSPHNVLVTFAGEVKIVDFGIARLIHSAETQTPTNRPAGGKYAYMSPEQAQGEPVDHRTDVFSAGIVLWELLAGHRLYRHTDVAAKLELVRQAVIDKPTDDVHPALWDILRKALARDRDDRYASAALLEEDLRAWLFDRRYRVGRAELSQLIRDAFPAAADAAPEDLDLQRMVADVERLDPDDRTASHVTPAGTPTQAQGALPGRLQAPVGERKKVVALMVDVDGITALSARIEPEQLFKRRYQLLRWFRRIVDPWGGHLQHAVDDHILILFGVPRTREDDVSRALECAQELARRVGELLEHGLALNLAMGVHTGEVTVGAGRRHRVRYVARGNTTRLARRLSAIADYGQVLASERVFREVEGAFHFKTGPDVPNRGGKKPWPSYSARGRRVGLRAHGKGSWIRRGAELEVIRNALVELAAGRGSAICLVGAVGTGKSRLVREIRDVAERRNIPFYAGRCTAFGTEAVLEPARDLVRDVLALDPDAPPDRVSEQAGRMRHLGLSSKHIGVIETLLGASQGDLTSEDVWTVLARGLEGLARDGPIIVAVEDLHHLPRRDVDNLAILVRRTKVPCLFLLSSREPLGERYAYPEVVLGPLSPEGQQRLIKAVLEADDVEPDVTELLERTCEGNPLYLQEMLKYLLAEERIRFEDGTASLADHTVEPAMPMSLAGMIAARIDDLDPASKGALQLAAIVGMTFEAGVLGEAAGVDDPGPLVTDLAGNGLIARARGGRGTWTFASQLVREAALRGILGVQRRHYHRMVAAAIETLHKGNLDSRAETLARHCAAGGRHVDAARYAFQAGEAHERRQYLERARACYEQGLRALEGAAATPDTWDARTQGEALLHYRHGAVSLLLGDTRIADHHLHLALDISADGGLPWVEVRVHLELGRSYLDRGRTTLAQAHVEQARALLRLEDDPQLDLEALEVAAILAHEQGRNEDAEALWNEALARADDDKQAVARCEIGLANRYLRSGQNDRARPLLDRALVHAREAGDRILEGRVLNNIGLVHSWADEQEEALGFYRQALEVREGIGYTRGVVVNHHNIGDVHFALGDMSRAWVAFARSRELAAEMGWARGVVLNDVYMGYIAGDMDAINRAIEAARNMKDAEIATTGAWLAGRWMMEHEEYAKARDWLDRALAEAEQWDLAPMANVVRDTIDALPTSDHRG